MSQQESHPDAASSELTLAQIDFHDPKIMECPYEAHKILRDQAPLHKLSNGTYVATRFADVEAGLSDHEHYSRDTSGYHDPSRTYVDMWTNPAARQVFKDEGWDRCWPHGNVINSDPPIHTKYRKLMDPMFTSARVREAGPFIRQIIKELINSFIDQGEIDFVERFAVPLPMRMICGLLGFPPEDLEQLKVWSTDMAASLSRLLSPEEEVRVARSMVRFQHYIAAQLAKKRSEPKDDILSYLAKVPLNDESGYTLADMISLTFSMHIGGNESTTNALTSGIWLLCENPGLLAEMRGDSALIRNFVEETLRLESPFQTFSRAVRTDVEMEGVILHKNDKVDFRLGAANRDPRRFENPDKVDLHRRMPGKHLAFSTGVHHCLGANLARFEMTVAYEELFHRLGNIRLVPDRNDFEHFPHFMFRGLKKLHIAFDKVA